MKSRRALGLSCLLLWACGDNGASGYDASMALDDAVTGFDAPATADSCLEDTSIATGQTSSAACIQELGGVAGGYLLELFGTTNTGSFNNKTILYQFSLSLWTRALNVSPDDDANTVVGHNHSEDPGARPIGNDSFRIRWVSESVLEFATVNMNQTGLNVRLVDGLDAKAWNHIVLVYDNGTDCMRLHVNGPERAESCPGGSYYATGGLVMFGHGTALSEGFNGLIDEVTGWRAGLSAQEVLELYNEGLPSDLSTHSRASWIHGHWRMGESAAGGLIPDANGGEHQMMVTPDMGTVRFVDLQ